MIWCNKLTKLLYQETEYNGSFKSKISGGSIMSRNDDVFFENDRSQENYTAENKEYVAGILESGNREAKLELRAFLSSLHKESQKYEKLKVLYKNISILTAFDCLEWPEDHKNAFKKEFTQKKAIARKWATLNELDKVTTFRWAKEWHKTLSDSCSSLILYNMTQKYYENGLQAFNDLKEELKTEDPTGYAKHSKSVKSWESILAEWGSILTSQPQDKAKIVSPQKQGNEGNFATLYAAVEFYEEMLAINSRIYYILSEQMESAISSKGATTLSIDLKSMQQEFTGFGRIRKETIDYVRKLLLTLTPRTSINCGLFRPDSSSVDEKLAAKQPVDNTSDMLPSRLLL